MSTPRPSNCKRASPSGRPSTGPLTARSDATAAQADPDAASAEIDSFGRTLRRSGRAGLRPAAAQRMDADARRGAGARQIQHHDGRIAGLVKDRVSAARDALARWPTARSRMAAPSKTRATGGAAIVECDPPVMTANALGGYKCSSATASIHRDPAAPGLIAWRPSSSASVRSSRLGVSSSIADARSSSHSRASASGAT
jgi:hypothetical protein